MPRDSDPKQRILETATRLFFSQGYHATGINQILDEAKVAKASLYLHYGSKEEVGVAYLKTARLDWFRGLEKLLDAQATGREKIIACFNYIEKNLRANSFQGCRFINMMAEIDNLNQDMHKQIVEHKTKLRRLFHKLVAEVFDRKTKGGVTELADTIYLIFEGAIIESKIYKDIWPIEAAKKAVTNLLK